MFASMSTIVSRTLAATAIALLVALTGCSSVSVKQPFGQPASEGITQKLSGAWQLDEQVVHIATVDGETVRIALLEYDEGVFELKQMDAIVREVNGMHFVFIRGEKPGDDYGFAQLVAKGKADNLVVYGPNVEMFAELVRDGKLNGEVVRDKHATNVNLADAKTQLEELIGGENGGSYFKTDSPLVLRRVGQK